MYPPILLSDIDYDHAHRLVFELHSLFERVQAVAYQLEKQQIEEGVGITVAGPQTTREFLTEFASQKERLDNLRTRSKSPNA